MIPFNIKWKLGIILVLVSGLFFPNKGNVTAAGTPRNVIMMVMDGTSSNAVTLARWYKGGPLVLDGILVGGVRTASLHSAITDSPAAGTALATGNKTIDDVIGMTPGMDGKSLVPMVNLSEAAKRAGLATGIVSTSEVQHATPASYSAHVTGRGNYHDIAEQQVYQGLDVVLGGGKSSLMAKNRADREDLLAEIKNLGYKFVDTRAGLVEAVSGQKSGGKVWGSFSENALSNHFDREHLTPLQPTLAEMTDAALGLLNTKNEKGFFLFVEGSKVDWAAHKNDPVGIVSEVLGFDEAVEKALEFARKDGNTLVIAVADHGNSGLSIGSQKTDDSYMKSPAELFVKPLKKAGLTLEGALATMKPDRSNLREVATRYGLKDLSRDEWRQLKRSRDLEGDLTKLLSQRARLGFTTHGHTGEDVFLYAFGPPLGKPSGLIENTEIASVISRYLGIGLNGASSTRNGAGAQGAGSTGDQAGAGTETETETEGAGSDEGGGSVREGENVFKYVAAKKYFTGKGYEVEVRGRLTANPVFVARKAGEMLEFPENKNYYLKNGAKVVCGAPNVFNGGDFFVVLPLE